MTDYIITTSATVSTTAYTLASGDTLSLASSALLAATGGAAPISMSGGRATIAGTITTVGGRGVPFTGGSGAQVTITTSGSLTTSGAGVGSAYRSGGGYTSFGHLGGSVFNAGSIFSLDDVGVGLGSGNSTTAAPVVVRNSGLISGQLNGIFIFAGVFQMNNSGTVESRGAGTSAIDGISFFGNPSTFEIDNSGSIKGAGAGISGQIITLVNSGLITSGASSFFGVSASTSLKLLNGAHGEIRGGVSGGAVVDQVDNFGLIVGGVSLGGGDDRLDNTYGVISGNIVGGLGADTITGGDSRDVIYGDDLASTDVNGGTDTINAGGGDDLVFGGYGIDTISGGYGDDVLNGGFGNDVLYGNPGDDVLYGNQDNDWMHGGQGNDVLYGGQGSDIVNGGVGDDVLFGNLGDDSFVFTAQGFGHDTIADFSRTSGNTDTITFGPGIFASFADLQAHAIQMSTGVLLYDQAGDTVLIVGATTGGLTADMFVIG